LTGSPCTDGSTSPNMTNTHTASPQSLSCHSTHYVSPPSPLEQLKKSVPKDYLKHTTPSQNTRAARLNQAPVTSATWNIHNTHSVRILETQHVEMCDDHNTDERNHVVMSHLNTSDTPPLNVCHERSRQIPDYTPHTLFSSPPQCHAWLRFEGPTILQLCTLHINLCVRHSEAAR